MARDYDFWIYIVTNRNHSVLYIGGSRIAFRAASGDTEKALGLAFRLGINVKS
jgi:hypothetical protein